MKWKYKVVMFLTLLIFCVGSVCAVEPDNSTPTNLTEEQKVINNQKVVIDTLKADNEALNNTINNQSVKINELNTTVNNQSVIINSLKSDNEVLNDTVNKQNIVINTLKSDNKALNDTINNQSVKINELNTTVNKQTVKINELISQISIDTLKTKNTNSTDLNKKINPNYYIRKLQLFYGLKNTTNQSDIINKLCEMIQFLEKDNFLFKNDINKLKSNNYKLKADNEALNNTVIFQKALIKNYNNQSWNITKFKVKNNKLKFENDNLKGVNTKLKSDNKALNNTVNNKNAVITKLKTENNKLKADNKALNNTVNNQNVVITNLKNEITNLKTENANLKGINTNLKTENTKLKDNKLLNNTVNNKNDVITNLKGGNKNITEIEQLKEEIKELKIQIKELIGENNKLKKISPKTPQVTKTFIKGAMKKINRYITKYGKKPKSVKYGNKALKIKDFLNLKIVKNGKKSINQFKVKKGRLPNYVVINGVKLYKQNYRILFTI